MDFTAFPITYSFTWSPKISFIEIDLLAISLLSKVTEVRLEQSLKAELLMLVTLSGMVTEVRLLQILDFPAVFNVYV